MDVARTPCTNRHRASSTDSKPEPVLSGSSRTREKEKLESRLRSFSSWTGAVRAVQLAIAGFMYVGPGDKVQCDSCKVKLSNWTSQMLPLEAHREHSPGCSFLQKWFPVRPECSTVTDEIVKGYDASKAKYQDKLDVKSRIASFNSWPLNLAIHSPQNMAVAGFFFIGSADRVRCFHCGLTLKDWDVDDLPLKAHLQWSPSCQYIKSIHKNIGGPGNCRSHTGPGSGSGGEMYKGPGSSQSSPLISDENTEDRERRTSKRGSKPASHISYSNSSMKSSFAASPALLGEPGNENSTCSSSSFTDAKERWNTSTQVEAVVAMGYTEELVQKTINKRLRTEGIGFPDVISLFSAVEELAAVV